MKVREIEKLLTAFYDGKTTEEQEEMLKKCFETANVPEHLVVDQKLFLGLHTTAQPEIPFGLEESLINLIDRKAEEEKQFMVKSNFRPGWKQITSIAAGFLLLMGLGYGIAHLRHSTPKDTFTNPQEAYNAIEAVLIEISSTLNDGMAQFIEVHEDVNEINKAIIEEI